MVVIGVIGTGESSPETDRIAEEVGMEIGKAGEITLNGGLGGVMEASARGAKRVGGLTVGLLPGLLSSEANPFIDIPIPTGMGDMRNVLIVRASEVVIAIGGGFGTLSEISIALKIGKPVIGINTWRISKKIIQVRNPKEAVKRALKIAKNKDQ